AAQGQLEQLREARDRMLETLKSARRSVDEITLRFDGADSAAGVGRSRSDEAPAEPDPQADDRAAGSAEPTVSTKAESPSLPSLPEAHDVGNEGVRIIGTRPGGEQTRPANTPVAERRPQSEAQNEPKRPAAEATSSPPEGREAGGSRAEPRKGERRSSALRILRRGRGAESDAPTPTEPTPAVDLPVVDQRPGEGVRILASTASDVDAATKADEAVERAATHAGADEAPVEVPEVPEVPEGDEGPADAEVGDPFDLTAIDAVELPAVGDDDGVDAPVVDDIFARIRAEREATTAAAREVLASNGGGKPDGEPGATASATGADAAGGEPHDTGPNPGVAGESPAEHSPDGVDASAARADQADEALLEQRDRAVAEVEESLVRRLKRALQDEQNATLDRLRTHRGALSAEALLGDVAEQASPYREVAAGHLEPIARSGAAASPMGTASVAVDDLAAQLAEDLAGALRQRLERAVERAVQEELELAGVAERINSVYRESKTQRIEPMAAHYVSAAYNRGIFLATPEGVALRWVFDDDGPCPDCDDNVVGGPTPRGEAYPTGQLLPPAHVGCRCLLASITT
ncbi:MAG: hypothetical protein ACR2H3_08040, partial [Acidimicrobiales bacterium]